MAFLKVSTTSGSSSRFQWFQSIGSGACTTPPSHSLVVGSSGKNTSSQQACHSAMATAAPHLAGLGDLGLDIQIGGAQLLQLPLACLAVDLLSKVVPVVVLADAGEAACCVATSAKPRWLVAAKAAQCRACKRQPVHTKLQL